MISTGNEGVKEEKMIIQIRRTNKKGKEKDLQVVLSPSDKRALWTMLATDAHLWNPLRIVTGQ